MDILFLTTEGFDTPNANNQMAMVMIREFLKNGNRVHLIQSRREKKFPDIPDMLQNKENLVVETVDRKIVGKKSFVSRYLNELHWVFQSFSHWRKIKKNVDVVFMQSCPTATYQLLLLKLFCRKPVLFNVYDMWPGNLLELGITNSRILVNIFRWIQRIGFSCCSKIAVLSEDMRQKMIQEGVPEKKLIIIPAWFDDEAVVEVPKEKNRFLKKYQLNQSEFIAQFAGSIGYTFDYKIVLRAAKILSSYKDIRIQIIGDGSFKDDLINEYKELGLSNIDFYPLQPVEIVPDVYSAADIEIIPLRKTTIGVGVPSKAPIVMACRRVIVNAVEEESDYYKLFNDFNMGISVPVENAEKLAEAIVYLYEHREEREGMVERAYKYTCENYSSTVCTQKILSAFTEMMSK